MKASTFLTGTLILFSVIHGVPSSASTDLLSLSCPEKKKQAVSKSAKKGNPFLNKLFFMSKYSYSL